MKKQTIIITGASSGIGKEAARHFLWLGNNVVINSTTAEKLEQVYHELGAGANLAMVAGDVSTVAKSNFINGAIINVDGGFAAGHNLHLN
jgi:short-subunit dehydrogenase